MNVVDINSANSRPMQQDRGDAVSIETIPIPKTPRTEGRYFGAEGAICEALFTLLAALYEGRSLASSRTAKFCTFMGNFVLYVVVRIAYDPQELHPDQLVVLTSVGREFKQYSHSIHCGEYGLKKQAFVPFTTEMLLVAGLMRAHDALYAANKPGSPAYHYFCELREQFDRDEYEPLEVKIHILRALAWFTYKYPAREYIDAKKYAGDAMTLAVLLHDEEQIALINREFTEFFQMSHQCKARTKGEI